MFGNKIQCLRTHNTADWIDLGCGKDAAENQNGTTYTMHMDSIEFPMATVKKNKPHQHRPCCNDNHGNARHSNHTRDCQIRFLYRWSIGDKYIPLVLSSALKCAGEWVLSVELARRMAISFELLANFPCTSAETIPPYLSIYCQLKAFITTNILCHKFNKIYKHTHTIKICQWESSMRPLICV